VPVARFGRSRRKIQAAWDEEWGRVGKELNPWWLGSRTANFEMVMGKSKLGWFRKSLTETLWCLSTRTHPCRSPQCLSLPARMATMG
jgi:hypothetical protein